MIQKSYAIVLMLIGALLVIALLLFRADLGKAARRGPAARRLVELGACLLAFLGLSLPLTGCGNDSTRTGNGDSTAVNTLIAERAGSPVARTEQWKRLVAVWNEATAIANDEKGSYPFDTEGKKKLVDALKQAVAETDELLTQNLLTESEAGLLTQTLQFLLVDVKRFRPTEMKDATCYMPVAFGPIDRSIERLNLRIPLLEKLVANGDLHPEVISKVVANMERDLAYLEKEIKRYDDAGKDTPDWDSLVMRVRVLADSIAIRMPEASD